MSVKRRPIIKINLTAEAERSLKGWPGLFDKVRDVVPSVDQRSLPECENIFRIFRSVTADDVKVIILGQDPYHNGAATGHCFEVKTGFPINPSWRNIVKKLNSEGFDTELEFGHDLSKWTNQGVLLLNTALTVMPSDPESDLLIWRPFILRVINYISSLKQSKVWMLWGKKAQVYEKDIDFTKSNFAVTTSHPSPLGARYGWWTDPVFVACNSILKNAEIKW